MWQECGRLIICSCDRTCLVEPHSRHFAKGNTWLFRTCTLTWQKAWSQAVAYQHAKELGKPGGAQKGSKWAERCRKSGRENLRGPWSHTNSRAQFISWFSRLITEFHAEWPALNSIANQSPESDPPAMTTSTPGAFSLGAGPHFRAQCQTRYLAAPYRYTKPKYPKTAKWHANMYEGCTWRFMDCKALVYIYILYIIRLWMA